MGLQPMGLPDRVPCILASAILAFPFAHSPGFLLR
jgi:hypothetical protein